MAEEKTVESCALSVVVEKEKSGGDAEMKVLKRGAISIDEFGNYRLQGWTVDCEGKSVNLKDFLKFARNAS